MTRMLDSAWENVRHALYLGRSVRLHHLNKNCPEEFWNATKDYVNTYAESVVETDDFRHIMKTQWSIRTLLDQWFDDRIPASK